MLFVDSPLLLALSAVVALLLDRWWGEPRCWHPLVGFGRWASAIERFGNCGKRLCGVLALLLALLPLLLIAVGMMLLPELLWWLAATLLLYLAIGQRSLAEHGEAVQWALAQHDLTLARERVGYMVSRQTADMDSTQVTKATLESLLENGSDAIFAPLFWYLLAGPLAVVLYRLVNTLDAMWGYRNQRFEKFGWAAARFDDLLNWLPARLCAWSYILAAGLERHHIGQCRRLWRQQAPLCDSPNGGPVMSAGASALHISLGGRACYDGVWKDRPLLGDGPEPNAADIGRAIGLIGRAVKTWLLMGLLLAVVWGAVCG
ncbi:MAG: adenosylcobinamide-phosphate synthase CbiB [Candidatus Pelagadaptatus aseana]|uniref:adenosylcobinamide-phosphate synthase CbiB n=1 Tax=Candidatus Pelagadaptatus aseana TaxID=3120508 RepID=UPI0039B1B78B